MKTRLNKAIVAAFLILGAVAGVLSSPATAFAVDPPATLTIHEVRAYTGVFEDGDMLIAARIEIDYATFPTDTVTVNFLARFMNGTTELQSVAPYTYNGTISDTTQPPTRGYGQNIVSFYFSALDMATEGITYSASESYSVIVQGNPAIFSGDPPSIQETNIVFATAAASQASLTAQVIVWAQNLEADWAVNDIDLINPFSSEGALFTNVGAGFITNAIPNLQTMIPSLFSGSTIPLTITEREFENDYNAETQGFFDGTTIGSGFQAGADLLGTQLSVFKGLVLLVLVLGMTFFVGAKTTWPLGFVAGAGTFVLLPVMGVGTLGMVMVGATFGVLLMGFLAWYKFAT